jgi:hypothetical protein
MNVVVVTVYGWWENSSNLTTTTYIGNILRQADHWLSCRYLMKTISESCKLPPLSKPSAIAYPTKPQGLPTLDADCHSSTSAFPSERVKGDTEIAAVGAAIHRYLQGATTCRPIAVTVDNRIRCTNDTIGDVCIIEFTVDSRIKFVLGTAYIHPGTSQRDTRLFLSVCSWHRVCSSRHVTAR